MERVLIIADMEGCIGIENLDDEIYCKKMMKKEVENIVNYLLQTGMCQITVADSHNNGKTILDLENKIASVKFVSFFWNVEEKEKFDYAILVGFHAMEGIEGKMSHTFRPEIKAAFMGEKICGEVSLIINWLAYYNIKTIFISGESALKSEIADQNSYFFESNNLNNYQYQSTNEICKKYDDMILVLQEAWENRKRILQKEYSNEAVKISFFNSLVLEFMPKSLYKIIDDELYFENTRIFVEELYLICQYINFSDFWMNKLRKKLVYVISNVFCSKEDFISNEKELYEIMQKEYCKLTLEEITYLDKKYYEMEKLLC